MKKWNFSFFIISIMSIILISSTAFAITISNSYGTPTINGKNYNFTSEVWDRYGPTVEAVANVKSEDGNVPAGYMGGQARLYNTSGILKASTAMQYNDVSSSGLYVYSSRIRDTGTYYAQSKAAFYTGNGYNSYTGFKSPNLSIVSAKSASTTTNSEVINDLMLQTVYAKNSNGETYGSAISEYTIGVEPDLINAVGTNGVEGYVRADDLNPNVSSIAEAIKLTGKSGSNRKITLYDADGTTVLGKFDLISNYELVTGTESNELQ